MKKTEFSCLIIFLVFIGSACQKDVLDLNDMSKKYSIERELSFPLVQGNISFKNLLNIDPDSIQIINLLDTLGIYYNIEYEYYDTIKMGRSKDSITIDFANFYYWFINQFPIGLNAKIYLCDSLNVVKDSILFSNTVAESFLPAAPVDANGVVILDQVKEKKGIIIISSSTAENLMKNTDKLILYIRLTANTFSVVKILENSYLHFQFAVDIKGKISGNKI